MLLSPRVKEQIVVRVMSSEPLNKSVKIDINGEICEAEKVIGFNFKKGEYALLRTFKSSDKSLVVAMTPHELKYYQSDIEKIKSRIVDQKKVSTRFYAVKTAINEQEIIEQIKFIFQPNLSVDEFEESLKHVFSIIALQDDPKYSELKEKLYQKTDDYINRKIVQNKSFTEVHKFLETMIRRIKRKSDHYRYFQSIYIYLIRLKKLEREGKITAEKISYIFQPLYDSYTQKYGSKFIDMWIKKINII